MYTNLHNPIWTIMTGTDEFRTEALQFEQFGYYTKHPVGSLSAERYWTEQGRRCVYGYKRPGHEWIPGYFYFYLNFSPIMINKVTDDTIGDSDLVRADRIKGFPNFYDGDYEYFSYLDDAERSGNHAVIFKSRGIGFSFKSASMCNRNYFMLPGSTSFIFAESEEYLTGDGILSKAWSVMDFIDQNTAWGKRRGAVNNLYHKRASMKVTLPNGVTTEKGFMSEIIGVPVGNDIDKTVRGKRGKLIIWEESGKNKYLLKGWNMALRSMQSGKYAFGMQIAGGTGGSDSADMMAIEELWGSPNAYRVHSVPNKWEPGQETRKVGFFWPVCMNLEGYMDADGNSDIQGATEFILNERKKILESAKNSDTILQKMAEEPLKPSEAMLRPSATPFNTHLLRECMHSLEANDDSRKAEFIGELIQTDKGIEWKPRDDVFPIRDFPLRFNDHGTYNIDGCPIIYEMPFVGDDGRVPYGLYIAGTDPYDDDKTDPKEKDSLGCTFVMNVLTGRIVAEYTGRPKFAKDYYEGVRKLLLFYNAICNYEQNKKGMFAYFDQMMCIHLLADTPKILRDMDMIKHTSEGNRAKGTIATMEVNKFARELIKNWTESPAYGKEDLGLTNTHITRSLPLIKELLYWNIDDNFDRVSALGMVLILRMDMHKIKAQVGRQIKEKSKDPFFDRLMGKPVRQDDDDGYISKAKFDDERGVFIL